MAIDPIKKLTILSPMHSSKRLLRTVSSLGVVDVTDASEGLTDSAPNLRIKGVPTEDIDDILHKIDGILNLLKTYAPEEQGFFQGLTPVPQIIDKKELKEATENYDLAGRSRQANEIDEILRRSERAKGDIENRLTTLCTCSTGVNNEDFHRPRRVRLMFGHLPRKNLEHLSGPASPLTDIAWEPIEEGPDTCGVYPSGFTPAPGGQKTAAKDNVRVLIAVLADDVDEVKEVLSRLSFIEMVLPDLSGTIGDHVRALEEDLVQLSTTIDETIARVRALASDRRTLIILKAFWTAARNERLALTKTLGGKWVHLLTGYIRARDVERLQGTFAKEFPDSVVILDDPSEDENVPVSLSLPKVFRPLSLLVEMFGLPPYRSFDPTPYLHINFYLFFGICFSDVGYGLMLIAASLYLIKRTKQYQGVADFGRILLGGGISTVIFGALLGSWFGDLYMEKYLGENNLLMRIQSFFVVLDPISKTIYALLFALLIGVLNQFFGIALRMYGAIRKGDWKSAVFDGLFWYLILPACSYSSANFSSTRPDLYRTASRCSVPALGLILTSDGKEGTSPASWAGRHL